jgi:glycosylphosphatidylinositol transamidase (GPIT) subunit GPI8
MSISSSKTMESFRHTSNALLIYKFFKENGIPDEKVN